MQICDELRQCFIRPKAPVHVIIIRCVVAMRTGLKDGSEIKRVDPQPAQMVNPFMDLFQPRHGRGVKIISLWRATKPQRVNVIKNRIGGPMVFHNIAGAW